MDMAINNTTHRITVKLLRPLAKLLLKLGVSYASFSEAARQAFIEAAQEHLKETQQKATGSAISALTGLSRKEVKRVNEMDTDALVSAAGQRNRAVRVLSGWVSDSEFSNGGKALQLPLDGDFGSFQALVRRYSGDITTKAMLRMLLDANSVEVHADCVTLLRNAYLPMTTQEERLNILGTDTAELLDTISHNIVVEPEQRRYQRKVSVDGLSTDDLIAFQQYSNQRSQALLEEYDRWLSERLSMHAAESPAANPQHSSEDNHYVAVGIYFYAKSQREDEV